jgi:hypothetical protein
MLNKSRKVTGSIIIGRSIIVVEIPPIIQQSPEVPTSPAGVSGVSFLIVYMPKETVSDHIDDRLFAQSTW